MSARSNDISPPPRSDTITRSPSKRWPATDIERCSEKKISSADAGVATASAMSDSRNLMSARRLHVGVEHAHAKLARVSVATICDDRGHIGFIDRNLHVHHIGGPKLG